jgi:hypothetical protein
MPLRAYQLDFSNAFNLIGKLFVRGLGLRMRQQRGIDGVAYSRPEKSTLKARQRMLSGTHSNKKGTTLGVTTKGKERKVQAVGVKGLSSVPITRMLVSKDTAARGFEFTATKDTVKISVSESQHLAMGNRPTTTYAKIVGYNSRGQDDLNAHIKRPPLIFPTSEAEVDMMEKEMKQARLIFEREASALLTNKAVFRLRKVLKIA